MFHFRLIELESEMLAKEQASRGHDQLPPDCIWLLDFVEKQIGIRLSDSVPSDWRGWLSYKRNKHSLIICRGRAFNEGGIFTKWRAGLDVAYGLNTVTEFARGFDVTPPQDLDHLLLNFGGGEKPKLFLWYGENLAPYKLVFMADATDEPHHDLSDAVVEACVWILTRPKDQTLSEFLKGSRRKKADGFMNKLERVLSRWSAAGEE